MLSNKLHSTVLIFIFYSNICIYLPVFSKEIASFIKLYIQCLITYYTNIYL